ncbi:MAG: AbrB/MazE/SpoVT family DNA-binding domain-containing protein [Patescibacteria group bacterium]
MKETITITRKGQTTLPVIWRRKLGLGKMGGILRIRFNEPRDELVISKPIRAAKLAEQISRHIKQDTQPVKNVNDYYQRYRDTPPKSGQ